MAISLALIALVTLLGIVAGSIWIEDQFPVDDAARALLPRAQKVITQPIVHALSRQIERYVRGRAEQLYMNTGLSLDETIARFLDERIALAERRIYAYRLAQVGSPECIAALLQVFQTAPPEHQAFMAQLIGSTGNPVVKPCLFTLLNSSDPSVATAAIRGLSAVGGDDVVASVSDILKNEESAEQLRIEAARGLGTIGTPAARDVLTALLDRATTTDLSTQILNSLGQFEFTAVADVFQHYLNSPETPDALRVVAAEAMANSSPDSVPFLLNLAQEDNDADVRAAAAWAVGAHTTVKNVGPVLMDLAEQEPESDVRRRLYESLLPQSDIPADRLLAMVQAEQDVAARVAGFNAIGRASSLQPGAAAGSTFDREIVPELIQIATSPNSLNIQMRAVFALRRARSEAAQSALALIAQNARTEVATAARNGLRTPRS